MAGICPNCRLYYALDQCPRCGPAATSNPTIPAPNPWDDAPYLPDPYVAPEADDRYVQISGGRSGLFSVRGVVVDGQQVQQRFVPGAMPLRWLVLAAWAALVYFKAQDLLVAVFYEGLGIFLPIIIFVMLFGWVASKLRIGGCLLAGFFIGQSARPRSAPRDDGMLLTVHSSQSDAEQVLLAASVPVAPSEEVVVHGPSFGGTRHAWLMQGIQPTTFTRVGRGLVGTLVTLLVFVPQSVWLLVR